MAKRMTRSEVPVEQTWNLDDLFTGWPAWEDAMTRVESLIGSVTQYRGTLAGGAAQVVACLNAYENLQQQYQLVSRYASLNLSTDGTSAANQAAEGRAASLGARIEAETSFISSEILALPDGRIADYLAETPELAPYARMLERLAEERPHVLAPQTEQALAALGEVLDAPYMIYERSKASDMAFEPVTDGSGQVLPMSFGRHERVADTTLRRNAWASFTKGLKEYQNTFAATWATEVKKNVVMARLRGYASATEYLLARQEVSVEVYNNLHDVILKELAPHMRRYAELRKRVLGMDKMLYVDLEAPLDPDFAPTTTFEQAGEIVLRGLSVLGPEYTEIIATALKNRWVDWADNIGKSTGAFCSSPYGAHPYVLTTWNYSMRNALTLAHELGHAGHSVLSQRNQRLTNSRVSMFFSEAPSTINELLVGQDLMAKSADSRTQRWIVMQFLTTYHHNFVRHLIEGELQRRIYAIAEKGQTITAKTLNTVQGEILHEFWGDVVVIDDGARMTWMRQPHYYMGLYPYSYSAGLTVGTAVSQAIRSEGQPAVNRWISVLKAGGTKKPLELATMAGVDMANPEAIRTAVRYVASLVDEVVRGFQS